MYLTDEVPNPEDYNVTSTVAGFDIDYMNALEDNRKSRLEELYRLMDYRLRTDTHASKSSGDSIYDITELIIESLLIELYGELFDEDIENVPQDSNVISIPDYFSMAKDEVNHIMDRAADGKPITTGEYNKIVDAYRSKLSDVNPVTIARTNTTDEELDEALADDRNYMPYPTTFLPGYKYARRRWDNTLNSEYITNEVSLGLVKKFISNSSPTNFKIVTHSYYPSDSELNATDWYILT